MFGAGEGVTFTLLRAIGLGAACCRCAFGVGAVCVTCRCAFGVAACCCCCCGRTRGFCRAVVCVPELFGATDALSCRCALPWLRTAPFASGLFPFPRDTVLALPFGASLAVEACALFARLVGWPRVAVPREATGFATAGAVFGNCGRTIAILSPLLSSRSGFVRPSVGNAWSRIFIVGIFVRVALAIVFGSMPRFTIAPLRPVKLLTATVFLCTTWIPSCGRQWRRTCQSQKWLVGT